MQSLSGIRAGIIRGRFTEAAAARKERGKKKKKMVNILCMIACTREKTASLSLCVSFILCMIDCMVNSVSIKEMNDKGERQIVSANREECRRTSHPSLRCVQQPDEKCVSWENLHDQ